MESKQQQDVCPASSLTKLSTFAMYKSVSEYLLVVAVHATATVVRDRTPL
jgi:hypothetical protein